MQILRELATERGYFLRREAIRLGIDDRRLHRGVRTNELTRIRQGAYCHTDLWSGLSDEDRHLARAHAAHDLLEGAVVLSHLSALADYGCPLWRAPLERVHVTRTDDQASRLEAGVVHHRGRLRDDEVVERNGRLITSPTRSLLDAFTLLETPSAMVAGDWMLRKGLTTHEQLWAGKDEMHRWPKTLSQEIVIRLLDGDSESVGETLERHLVWRMHLPRPQLQYKIYDRNGRLIGITDFAWPEHGVYGEFDGKVKYGRLLKPGQDPGDVVFAEKRREDLIRGVTGGIMVRHTWADLTPHSEPSLRLRDLLRDGLTA